MIKELEEEIVEEIIAEEEINDLDSLLDKSIILVTLLVIILVGSLCIIRNSEIQTKI
ncbi:hypothetical protein [Nitrosopumilus sp.]|uniref:hypothetical protein n=1 Tax=Nitrosopumilus sp. TaxID=2024843 RepID=UPI00292CB3B9|nr:hypothetical protein [Nitrosopumilus sp.]